VTISGGGGAGAAGTASLGVTAATFSGVNVASGLTATPIVAISGGGGLGAFAVGNGTTVTAVTITNPGAGFTSAPNLLVTTSGAAPTTFAGNANSFQLVGVQLSNAGTGYTTAPTVTVNGGTGAVASATLSAVNLATDTTVGGTGDININAVVSGPGVLTKVGGGTLNLTGANTYAGTLVNAGTLRANNTSGSATGVGSVTVAPGGTLGGSGFVVPNAGGTVTINGAIAPGNSVGTLTLGSSTTPTVLNLNGTYIAEVVGTTSDLINVFGDLNLGPASVLNVQPSGAAFDGTTTYSILSYSGTYNGTPFASNNVPANYTISYPAAGPGPGIISLVPVPVPEPAAVLAACGLAAGGFGWLRRRK
jgi:autotransporter-associated beta strand protein